MTDDPQIRRAALLRAQAALDGELDAANSFAFERDVAGDEALRRAQANGEVLRAVLRAHAPREAAPEALRKRVLALAEPPARTARPRLESRWIALAASLVAVAFIAGYFSGARNGASPDETVLRPLVDSYARAEIAGQPFDVASSDRHTVKPWLASRLTLGSEVVDLADAGFPLAGGRVDMVNQTPVATLVYRHREHWISVSELPPSSDAATNEVSSSMLNGFRLRKWRDAARVYVAVSDIDAGELDAFVEAFRRKAGSEAEPTRP